MGGDGFPRSLVIASCREVRMFVRLSSERAFSLDTR